MNLILNRKRAGEEEKVDEIELGERSLQTVWNNHLSSTQYMYLLTPMVGDTR